MSEILRVENLKKYFFLNEGILRRKNEVIKAVDGVSFRVERKKTFGIAGESGSGKSTLCMCIARLMKPQEGRLYLDGIDYTNIEGQELKMIRSRLQIVFQNPASSLDPHMRIKDIILEPVRALEKGIATEQLVKKLLKDVGLPEWTANRYPHELSGGMMQRVAIARAISIRPEVIILDEPTSALDASVQAQILNLFNSLQDEYGVTYILVSHDLSVIGHMCDDIAIMYAGKIVECGRYDEIFYNPKHPYTLALLASSGFLDKENLNLEGEPPSPRRLPSGCTFHPRCKFKSEICERAYPEYVKITDSHISACHNVKKLEETVP